MFLSVPIDAIHSNPSNPRALPTGEWITLSAVSTKRSRSLLKAVQGQCSPLAKGQGAGSRKRALNAIYKPSKAGRIATVHCVGTATLSRLVGGSPFSIDGPVEVHVPPSHS